jgi:hypothetical protein
LTAIRDVRAGPVDPGLLERLVEEPSGRADERLPPAVLLVSGLLADEHQVGRAPALADHRLGRVLPEPAAAAALNRLSERGEASPFGQVLRGAHARVLAREEPR